MPGKDWRPDWLRGRVWLLYLLMSLGIIYASRGWASAALANLGALECGHQWIVQKELDAILGGRTIAPSTAISCAAAFQKFQAAQRLSPDSARTKVWIGYAHLAQGDLSAAASAFDGSARLGFPSDVTWLFSGLVYDRLGKTGVAVERWGRVSNSTRAITALANRLAEQGQCIEAEVYYRLAIQQASSGLDQTHLRLANCLYKLERWSEAAAKYRVALEGGLRSAEAANRLGNLLVQLGRPREAIPYLEQALEWHLYPFYMIDLAKGYEASGDLTRAEYVFVEIERQFPNASAGFWEGGNYYLRREQYQVAIVHFRQAVTVDPRCPYYCYSDLGRAYLAAGCPREAAEAFAEALRRDPAIALVAEWLKNAEALKAIAVGKCP